MGELDYEGVAFDTLGLNDDDEAGVPLREAQSPPRAEVPLRTEGPEEEELDAETAEEDGATNEDQVYDYGTDSIGGKCPRHRYGHRIIQGSRRPKGAPPEVWKKLSAKTKSELADASSGAHRGCTPGSASVAGAVGDEINGTSGAEFTEEEIKCRDAVKQWYRELEEYLHSVTWRRRGCPCETSSQVGSQSLPVGADMPTRT